MNISVNIPVYPTQNQLLASLPTETHNRLALHLKECHLPVGKFLCDADDNIPYIYFPIDSIVSLVYVTKEGKSAEISMIGNEGLVGIANFMGGECIPTQAVVQSAGSALRMPGRILMNEFNLHSELHELILRYIQLLLCQMAQTSVCYRYHTVNQRLCRWLLLFLDRASDNKLTITHELIASMLGVRREGITFAAGKLRKQGVINYCRGHITVMDRSLLEEQCCECYSVVKQESDRLIPSCAHMPHTTLRVWG